MSKSVEKLQARRATLVEQLAKVDAQIADATMFERIVVGSAVEFKYGRGETVKTMTGTVTGSKVGDNGVAQFAVESGEGFDKVVVRIPATSITAFFIAPEVQAEVTA